MKRWLLLSAAALALCVASPAPAQEGSPQNGLARLFSRTEVRARGARQNFEALVGRYPAFLPEVQAVAARLGTRPEWLLNMMACESAFIPSARNRLPGQTASGLMQFIEQTAARLGTTTARIRRMNPVEQLHLVERFYWPFRGRLNSLADVYLAAFRGFLVAGGPETVVAPLNNSVKERQAYSLNRSLDLNGDRNITKEELAAVAYGVGRFGSDTQSISKTSAQLNDPRQQASVNQSGGQSKTFPPSSTSLYVASTINKPMPGAARKTRSIYVR